MGKKINSNASISDMNNLNDLMEKANEVGIVNISAYGRGGVSENILKDAIETTEYVKKYFAEHPEK